MLVALLMALLLAGAMLFAVGHSSFYQASAPSRTPVESDKAGQGIPATALATEWRAPLVKR